MSNHENLNVELKKLTDICLKLKPWVEGGLLDYRRMLSEETIQMEKNAKLKVENEAAEEGIKKAIQSADMILAQARAEERELLAKIQTLWTRAQSKFKEVEKRIDDADRRSIRGMIKELETSNV